MKRYSIIFTAFFVLPVQTICGQAPFPTTETIERIEMKLSAFGVESDDFPSIDAVLDFARDTIRCIRSFDNPAYKASSYNLTGSEMKTILDLLKISDLKKLKTKYETNRSDQPASTTVIYTTKAKYVFSDYGLIGDFPLTNLYRIVYKL